MPDQPPAVIAAPAPVPATASAPLTEKPLSTSEWFVTLLILALPFVGIVMYFVWAFAGGNISRRNFCRAVLLWFVVVFALAGLALVCFLLLGGTLAALGSLQAPR